LHDESDEDWQKWFDAAGIRRENTTAGPNFSDNALMLQAASQGLGACLGSPVLAAAMIRDGRLAVLSDVSLIAARSWYLVTLERNLKHAWVRALWDWMLKEAAQDAGLAASSGKKQAD
jgi:DNA-binding transcriptional LysR family regulator